MRLGDGEGDEEVERLQLAVSLKAPLASLHWDPVTRCNIANFNFFKAESFVYVHADLTVGTCLNPFIQPFHLIGERFSEEVPLNYRH